MLPLVEGLNDLIKEVEAVEFLGMKGMGSKFTKRKATRRKSTSRVK